MILNRIFGIENRTTLVTGYGPQNDATLKAIWGTAGRTKAGVDITAETCLALSAVYAAVKLLAWTRGSLPLNVYRRLENDDREIAKDHPLFNLIHNRPNQRMSSMVYREIEMACILLWGDSYSWIERDSGGKPVGLWPIHPSVVFPVLSNDKKDIVYDVRGAREVPFSKPSLGSWEVLHIPGFGFDGIKGRSVISWAREQMGESLAMQELGGSFFGNGAFPGTVLKFPGRLQNAEAMRQSWERIHGGPGRAAKTAILEEGMDIVQIGMPLKDYQWIEGRQFHIAEVARWFGLPPHKLADLSRATFANIAEQNIDFVAAILPWNFRFKQEYDFKLFSEPERQNYFTDTVVTALLQANPEQKAVYYSSALQNGWMNRDEIRRLENLNSMGQGGGEYTVQSNLVPLNRLGELLDKEKAKQEIPGEQKPARVEIPVQDANRSNGEASKDALRNALTRMVYKEAMDIIRASTQPKGFLEWLEGYYERFKDKFEGGIHSACNNCRENGMEIDLHGLAERHCRDSKQALIELSGKANLAEFQDTCYKEMMNWTNTLPDILLKQAILDT